jgi:hypothetical protein
MGVDMNLRCRVYFIEFTDTKAERLTLTTTDVRSHRGDPSSAAFRQQFVKRLSLRKLPPGNAQSFRTLPGLDRTAG